MQADRLTHLLLLGGGFHITVLLSSWHAISWTTDEVSANMNRIIQGADFGAFPWLIGCELTCFLGPSCCLLVTVANNHHLTMLKKGCALGVSNQSWLENDSDKAGYNASQQVFVFVHICIHVYMYLCTKGWRTRARGQMDQPPLNSAALDPGLSG